MITGNTNLPAVYSDAVILTMTMTTMMTMTMIMMTMMMIQCSTEYDEYAQYDEC